MIPALPECSGIDQRPILERGSFPGSPPGKRWEGAGEGGGQRRLRVRPPWGGCRARSVAWGDGGHLLWGWERHLTFVSSPRRHEDCGGDTLTSRRLVRAQVWVWPQTSERRKNVLGPVPERPQGPQQPRSGGGSAASRAPHRPASSSGFRARPVAWKRPYQTKVLAITLHKKQNRPDGGGQGLAPSPRAGVSLKLNVGEQLTQGDAFGRAPDQHLPSGAGPEWVS